MEVLVVLLILAVIGLPLLLLAGVGGIAAKDAKLREKTSDLLDAAFDGRDTVVYETKVVGPQVKDVIEGADKRGYDLVHNVPGSYSTATLTFKKRPTKSDQAQPPGSAASSDS